MGSHADICCRPPSGESRKLNISNDFGSFLQASLLMRKIAEGRPRWPKMAPRWLQGGPLGALGRLLGASWGPLGASWGPLGHLLGASSEHSRASWGILFSKAKIGYVTTCLRCVSEPSWGRLGAILGPSWGHLGAILGPCWAHLEPSWAILGYLKRS